MARRRALRTRRRFLQGSLVVGGLGLLSGCGLLTPQIRPMSARRVGWLAPATAAELAPNLEAFRHGLRDLGYVEDRDISVEVRTADGRANLLPELAAELVRLQVDIILTGGLEAIRASVQATRTIPIVFAVAGDPVADGLVASLARPGGNVTGLTNQAGSIGAKRLQLLREGAPGLARVAVLGSQRTVRQFDETEVAAQTQGVEVLPLELSNPEDLDAVLAGAITGRADGLVVITDALFQPLAPRIVDFAATHRLPAIYGTTTYAIAGGLLTYGVRIPENYRRAATYVDKILKGAKPADLPVEQPTTFDFIINLKTAQALGLTLPESILSQATEIIQ